MGKNTSQILQTSLIPITSIQKLNTIIQTLGKFCFLNFRTNRIAVSFLLFYKSKNGLNTIIPAVKKPFHLLLIKSAVWAQLICNFCFLWSRKFKFFPVIVMYLHQYLGTFLLFWKSSKKVPKNHFLVVILG